MALGTENIWAWTSRDQVWAALVTCGSTASWWPAPWAAAWRLAGLALQALLRNPLADPFVLGVSGGASLAVILAGIWLSVAWRRSPDSSGPLRPSAVVYAVAQRRGRLEPYTLLLAGVIVNAFCAAAIMLTAALAGPRIRGEISFYMMGPSAPSTRSGRWRPWSACLALLAAAGFALLAKGFNLVAVGEDTAGAMGVPVHRLRLVTFVAAGLVTGASVALAGPIGFVGLICPHLLRMAMGPDYRRLVPASLFFGATFLVAADLAVAPPGRRGQQTPPVGVLTAMAGVPFFIYLLRTRWRKTSEIH